jgi:TonB-linked outer membrane protein, SusC/RagA family
MGAVSASPLLSQQARLDVNYRKATVADILEDLKARTDYQFIYFEEDIPAKATVTVSLSDAPLEEVLNLVLVPNGLTFTGKGNAIVIGMAKTDVRQQPSQQEATRTIEGIVVDKDNRPVVGATVRQKNINRGIGTDPQGKFRLTVHGNNPVVVISFIGMQTREITVGDTAVPMIIVLQEEQTTIDEVIVTGIFDKPKESFTGAVTVISREDIKTNYSRNLLQTIANLDPSMRIISDNQAGSDPNRLPEIHLRGETTLLAIEDINTYNSAGSNTEIKKTEAFLSLNSPLFILDGFEISLERVMDLNENEIENITILKDASSTAIYGSRGANGVIVITSTRPKAGRLTVTYRGELNLEIPDLSTYDLLNAREKLELEKSYGVWDTNEELYQAHMDQVESGRVFDWLKAPVRTGVGQKHTLSLSGGSEEWRYRFDLSNNITKGSMKGSERKNFNGSVNIVYMKKNFHISQTLSVGTNSSTESPYGSYFSYVTMNPYYYPYDEEGNPVRNYTHIASTYATENPMYDAIKGNSKTGKYTTIRSNTNVRYGILPGLYVVGTLGLSRQMRENRTLYVPSDSQFGGAPTERGSLSIANSTNDDWQARIALNYSRVFNEKHVLTTGFTTEVNESNSDATSWAMKGFLSDNITHPGMALGYPTIGRPGGSESVSRRLSFIGSVNYFYDNRYFFDASFSSNGSSSYGSNSRYGTFYSVGGGWNAANEKFMKENLPFVNESRLRYSFGVSGNVPARPEQIMETYGLNTTDLYLGEMGYFLMTIENPDLKWQNTYQHNIGLDLALFDNKLRFNFNYYNKLTTNAVNVMDIPISHGFKSITANVGKVRNEGLEYGMTLNAIRQPGDKLNLGFTVRLAQNRNTLVKLSDAFKELLKSTFSLNSGSEMMRYREGESMDAIYGLRSIGVDPQTGDRIYVTRDGEITMRGDNPDDLVYLGNMQPKVNGTISMYARYKGFRLNVGFQVRYGGMSENATELRKIENASLLSNMDRRILKDLWTKPGDKARYKSRLSSQQTYANDMFIHKDNIFSCGNINLEYSFPRRLVSRLGVEYLSLGVNLSDIFYFSSIRRERGTSYPFSYNPNFLITCTF